VCEYWSVVSFSIAFASVGDHCRGAGPAAAVAIFGDVIGRVQRFVQCPVLGVGSAVTPRLEQLDFPQRNQPFDARQACHVSRETLR
jgi:hypothetical protein